jgi:hypothetical protein
MTNSLISVSLNPSSLMWHGVFRSRPQCGAEPASDHPATKKPRTPRRVCSLSGQLPGLFEQARNIDHEAASLARRAMNAADPARNIGLWMLFACPDKQKASSAVFGTYPGKLRASTYRCSGRIRRPSEPVRTSSQGGAGRKKPPRRLNSHRRRRPARSTACSDSTSARMIKTSSTACTRPNSNASARAKTCQPYGFGVKVVLFIQHLLTCCP